MVSMQCTVLRYRRTCKNYEYVDIEPRNCFDLVDKNLIWKTLGHMEATKVWLDAPDVWLVELR